MGLCNIYQYQATKTIKLSDSYAVSVKLTDEDNEKIGYYLKNQGWYDSETKILELPECLSVTLPELAVKEEVYKYGNNSKIFLLPDYDKPDDLKIEVLENIINLPESNISVPVVGVLVNLFLTKLFDAKTFSYILTDYIPELNIKIYKNDFTNTVYIYTFKELKLTNYSKYTLDYSNASPCKWSLSFSFNEYTQEVHVEESYPNNVAVNVIGEDDDLEPDDAEQATDEQASDQNNIAPPTTPASAPSSNSDNNGVAPPAENNGGNNGSEKPDVGAPESSQPTATPSAATPAAATVPVAAEGNPAPAATQDGRRVGK